MSESNGNENFAAAMRRPPRQRWSRIWEEDAPEGTVARHDDRQVVRTGGRWVDVETGETVDVTTSGD